MRLKLLSDAVAVARNEFRQFTRNRTAILISLVILPLFFTLTLGGVSGAATARFTPSANVPVAFVDNDLSTDSGRLLQALRASGYFDNLILGYREENAVATLGTGKIYAAIIVPQGFQNDMTSNQTANIVLYTDDAEPGVGDSISSALNSVISNFNPNVEAQTSSTGLGQVQIVQKGAVFSGFNVGLVIVMGVVQIFAAFYEIAGGMSREREDGTIARLLVSPTAVASIMLGKTLFDSVLTTIRAFLVLGISIFVYGAKPNTDLGTILLVTLIIALVTMGFGFLMSAIRIGPRAVVIVEFFLILFLFGFSGLIIDRELLRGVSEQISYALPWASGFQILRRTVLIGSPLTSQMGDLGFILASTVAFYTLAYAIFLYSRERIAF